MKILNSIPDKREDRWTTSLKFKQDLIDYFGPLNLNNCIEIGTHKGWTARVLSMIFENVTTIEVNIDCINQAIEINKDRTNIEYLHGDAYSSDWNIDRDYDVAFIDCNHEYKYVKQDIENCLKYNVKYLIFDDYGLPEVHPCVKVAVDEFIKNNPENEISFVGEPAGNEPRIGRPLIDWEGVIIKIKAQRRKKVFIDAGANIGQSIENFISAWKDWHQYEIHSFEANPKLSSHFDKYKDVENITFYNKAVWTYDGNIEFYLCNDGIASSSVVKNKTTGALDKHPTIVESVDIGKFITQNYDKNDFIIFKLDVEGGEYELLDHLINTKALEYIDILYLEFHTGKVQKTKEDNQILLDRMKEFKNLKVNHECYNSFNFL